VGYRNCHYKTNTTDTKNKYNTNSSTITVVEDSNVSKIITNGSAKIIGKLRFSRR
jgi:glutathionyl-hydroquinone reductase